jgi:HSP20 family protein
LIQRKQIKEISIRGDIMALVRRDPWTNLSFLQDQINRMFWEAFPLPAAISPEKVVASYKAGVLEVKIPKPEEQKPKQIDIN